MPQPILHSKWTQHIHDKHDAEKFKELLISDKVVLGRLYAILEEMEQSTDIADMSIDEYLNPAWPYLKADRIGEKRAYQKIKQLLHFIKD